MLDPQLLRNNPDALRDSLTKRGVALDVDVLVDLEERSRQLRHQADEARAEQKSAGRDIANLSGEAKETAIANTQDLANRVKDLNSEADRVRVEFEALWLEMPNLVDPTAAEGLEEDDAEELRRVGDQPDWDFEPSDHATLGDRLGIIDTDRGAKVSGSRFGYVRGQGALLELALTRWAMDRVVAQGHEPVIPPVMVREHALVGTGFFPEAREQVYEVPGDELFLVGTSEVPLAAFHGDEILETDELPIRYAGYSTCFRRESGTYGKDTSGIFRVHQFEKVEIFVFCLPEESQHEHDRLLEIEESLVRELELPYRVVNIAAGDLGASATKKYDIEAWFPTQERYREITSTSNTTDFQARRLNIRYRSDNGTTPVHTLNGTACALGRTILAILENHQQADGSVAIPEALRPYTGFDVISPP
ncbi:MAG: serine--tRNA ligase [Acidimicrobiia bacterium]|nr:serine--tRNA ligase [Acidimicrobiia bacterium]